MLIVIENYMIFIILAFMLQFLAIIVFYKKNKSKEYKSLLFVSQVILTLLVVFFPDLRVNYSDKFLFSYNFTLLSYFSLVLVFIYKSIMLKSES